MGEPQLAGKFAKETGMLLQEKNLECVVSALKGLPNDGRHAQARYTSFPGNHVLWCRAGLSCTAYLHTPTPLTNHAAGARKGKTIHTGVTELHPFSCNVPPIPFTG